jgi:hypothetical protein
MIDATEFWTRKENKYRNLHFFFPEKDHTYTYLHLFSWLIAYNGVHFEIYIDSTHSTLSHYCMPRPCHSIQFKCLARAEITCILQYTQHVLASVINNACTLTRVHLTGDPIDEWLSKISIRQSRTHLLKTISIDLPLPTSCCKPA